MGGGKGGGSCSNVGFGYSLTFGYAFCDKLDELLSFNMNGKNRWTGSIINTGSFTAWTGNLGTTYSSNYGQTSVIASLGTQTDAPANVAGLFPHDLSYKNLCWLFFDNAFIGDNVMSVPKYRIKGRRTDIYNITTYSNIDGTANPAYVIYYILNKLLNINDTHIDIHSIDYAAQLLYTEGLGISFLLSRSHKVTKWIKEILRHIDGILYFDIFNGKYVLKLLRADYDTNNVITLTEADVARVLITRGTWKDIITTFIFTYTNTDSGKPASITISNTAAREVLGYDRPKKYSFPMISTNTALDKIISSTVKKEGFPKSSVKLRVSLMDFPNIYPGDVFSFEYVSKGIPKTVYRVVKLAGDSSDTSYLEIEAIEDIFANSLGLNTTITPPVSNTVNYAITSIPNTYVLHELDNEFTTIEVLISIVGKPSTTEIITQVVMTNTVNGVQTNTPVVSAFLLNTDIPQNYSYEADAIFNITDNSNNIYDKTYTDEEFQRHQGLLFINHKVFTYKSISKQPNGSFNITGLMALSKDIPLLPQATTTGFITTQNIISNSYLALFNTSIYNYSLAFKNLFTKGNSITNTKNRTNYAQYPLPCSNLKYYDSGTSNILVFSPSVRTKGASYISCDNIIAGNDENTYEGTFIIKYNGSKVYEITSPTFVNGYIEYDTTNYNTGTWEVVPKLNSFQTASSTITI